MHTIIIVQAQAMATNLSKSMGATLTTRSIIKNRLNDLLVRNITSPIQCYTALLLDSQEKLIDYSTTAQNNLLQKCEFDAKLIPETLRFLHDMCDQFRRKIQQPMTRLITQPTEVAVGRVELLENNKEELLRLAKQTEKDILVYKRRDICKALTRAMKLNWVTGGMVQQYLVQTKQTDDQLLATRIAPYLPAPPTTPARPPQQNRAPKKPYSPRKPKPQGGGKRAQQPRPPRGNNKYQPSNGNRSSRTITRLYTRRQQPKALQKEQDSQLGEKIAMTKIKYIPGSCNNFQIWNECALYKRDPTSCTYKHSCSLCHSPLHGRRSCPQLAAPEDPNA